MTMPARVAVTAAHRAAVSRQAAGMTENDLLCAVLDVLKVYGYRVAHFRPARTSRGWRTPVEAEGKGYPDLTAVGRGRILAVELKSATGKVTPEQAAWLEAFSRCGAEVFVWRPADLAAIPTILSHSITRGA